MMTAREDAAAVPGAARGGAHLEGSPQGGPSWEGRTVVASPETVSSALDGETVILSLDGGVYFGLDEVASRVWELIREPVSVDSLCGQLQAEYDIEPACCRAELIALLDALERAGLLQGDPPPAPK